MGPGDRALVHAGFAMAKVDEAGALETRRMLESMGEDYEQELEDLKAEHHRMGRVVGGVDLGSGCDLSAGCITCGDVAVALTVLRVDVGRGLALCVDGGGGSETVETDLVAPVVPGDRLLVHAGTAIARLTEEASG